MSSSRNNRAEDVLLDAARDCVLAVGLRRTTLTDVARRAGVSRMTIYRRWPDMTALVADLMTREWGTVTRVAVQAAAGDPPPGDSQPGRRPGAPEQPDPAAGQPDPAPGQPDPAGSARQRFVTAMVTAARTLRRHAMFRRIVELDPEILLPYLVQRRGRSQDAMLAMTTEAIAGADDGSMRRDHPGATARAVQLAVQGFVLSLPTMTDGADEDELDSELRLLLDRFLAP